MRLVEDISEMKAASRSAKGSGSMLVLVPTMGFLHDGHRALMRKGKVPGSLLVLSIFVNPAQFGPKEDFKAYPRDLKRDMDMAEEEGADIVFAPRAEEMYPEGYDTFVSVEGLSKNLCGMTRPGHFRGVATVVLKLFNIVEPGRAVFGKKDFQQFAVIKRMVEDLNLDIDITGIETVREDDGVALSSRNSYLSPEERVAARCVPASLNAARDAVASGQRDSAAIIGKMKNIMDSEPSAVVEYIKICDPRTLEDIGRVGECAVAAVAARIGRARLIDNVELYP